MKLNVFGHLDLSPSISSRTLKILENRLLRSLQHVHKNSVMKEIRKIFPQLKRYLVLKLVYKFLLPCFNIEFHEVLENMSVPETLEDGVKRVEPSPGMFPASLKLIG